MISVLPVKDREKAKELCEEAGVQTSLAYIEYEFGEQQGYILFGMTPEKGEIRAVSARNDISYDLMIRAVLSNLYDIGIEKAFVCEKADRLTAKRLGFIKDDLGNIDSIKDILYHCKNCKKY